MTLPPPQGVALESVGVRAEQVEVDLQLEVAGEELIAQGVVGVRWRGPCRRCLEDQQATIDVKLREIFQQAPVEGETYFLDKDEVDLEPMIREVTILHLPVAPLCSQDCAGPDPERFPTTVESDDSVESDHAEVADPPMDPRWGPLSQLTFDE